MILGIDVSGTHTDAVLIECCTVTKKAKVLTNEKNLLASLLAITTKPIVKKRIEQLNRKN